MEIVLAEVVERLEALHRTIEKAIDGMPDEAMDWRPGPGMNSLGVLLTHAMGAQRYWIGDVAGGDDSGRDREAEFIARGVGTAALIERGREVLAHSRSVLGTLSSADLPAPRTALPSGRQVTTAWAILHALEHTALHAGHIEITRQLWDAASATTEREEQ